ncbi:MAG: DUF4239 domain-containing protein [Deltaproteobacteria bacterium]|nr:DUF4239 domain-containing protein [Deltaproteobacteria bacterium]
MLEDFLTFLIITIATVVLALIVNWLRVKRPHSLDIDQKNLMSTNFSFFTTLYCFFLGFAVVTLWQSFNDTDATTTNEAMSVVTLYRLADNLPHSEKFRNHLVEYATSVVNDEWPSMAAGQPSEKTHNIKENLWSSLLRIKPTQPEDQSYYIHMLNVLGELDKNRHKRNLQIDGNLYTPIWVLIYMGLAFSIVTFYFIDVDHNKANTYYMIIMICLLLTNIFLIVELDKPFSGFLHLDPNAFQYSLKTMKAWH